MNEIQFVYFKKYDHAGNARRTDNEHVKIVDKKTTKGTTYTLTLNEKITNYILDKQCEFVCVGLNKLTGQKYLVFNKDSQNGYQVALPTPKNKKSVIYSKAIVKYIKNILNMNEEESLVWVSDDLSHTAEQITIEIKRA